MFVCAYDSEYCLVSLTNKSLKIVEITRDKKDSEFALIAVSDSGKEEVIAKFPYVDYCKNLANEIYSSLQTKGVINPNYRHRYAGHPDKTIF